MFTNKLEQLKAQLREYEDAKSLGEDIQALLDYPPFRRVVIQAYCRDSVVENMHSANDNNLPSDIRELCLRMASAPILFEQWFAAKQQIAKVASTNVEKLKMDMLREDDEEDAFDEETYQ